MDVGFLGLGSMGSAMARNLIKAGHTVRVWHRSPESAQALVADGGIAVASPAEAMRGEALVTMLANDDAIRAVVLDSDLLDAAPKTLVHVGCSTTSVALTKELTQAHLTRGLAYVSAPVFGRPDVAASGRLQIVVAGPADAISRMQPLFDAMGQKTWPLGKEPLRAIVVKIAGNLMIASAIEAMAEATTLGKAHGIEAAAMLDVYTSTIFACRVYQSYGASIAERRFEPPGFKLELGLKDVRLALQAGDEANVPLPFGSALRDAMIGAVAAGDGEKDWSALSDIALARAGMKPD